MGSGKTIKLSLLALLGAGLICGCGALSGEQAGAAGGKGESVDKTLGPDESLIGQATLAPKETLSFGSANCLVLSANTLAASNCGVTRSRGRDVDGKHYYMWSDVYARDCIFTNNSEGNVTVAYAARNATIVRSGDFADKCDRFVNSGPLAHGEDQDSQHTATQAAAAARLATCQALNQGMVDDDRYRQALDVAAYAKGFTSRTPIKSGPTVFEITVSTPANLCQGVRGDQPIDLTRRDASLRITIDTENLARTGPQITVYRSDREPQTIWPSCSDFTRLAEALARQLGYVDRQTTPDFKALLGMNPGRAFDCKG
ncbi:MAG: hypothetical protein H6707_03220 [Deltaproteobacteria bacterium]|nr:hypothetical protein [Deltaproteobacteria bacterium]